MANAAKPLKGNDVDTPSAWLAEDEETHKLATALREGVPSMRKHAANNEFMWPNPGEMELVEMSGQKTMTLYDLRIARSDLPNPWVDTIRRTARLPFRSSILYEGWDEELSGKTVKDETGKITEKVKGWVDDITGEGQSFDSYAYECFEDSLFQGVVYSFVDNDPRKFTSTADRRKAGARPRVSKFCRRHVRRITIENRFGMPRLKQIVLNQPIMDTDVSDPNNWREEEIPARKVVTAGDPDTRDKELRKVRTQIYLQDKDGKWYEDPDRRAAITPDDPREEMLDIPLFPHYSWRVAPYRGVSPFLDTAWMQAAIWNHNSEMGGLAREAALTFIHESGIMTDQKTGAPILGDTRNMRYRYSSVPNAALTINEIEGTSLASIMKLVEWKIALIEKAHHQISSEKSQTPVTAREITLEGVHASSALEMWVIFQEQCWARIMETMALLGGLTKRGQVSIPHDFGLPNTGMDRNHQLFMAGSMSPANYWPEAQRNGDVDERTFDLKAELAWWKRQEEDEGGGGDGSRKSNLNPGLISSGV